MKFVVQDLKRGDLVRGHVTELIDASFLIISFDGDLLRVQNHSNAQFQSGDYVTCRVAQTNPLRFELVSEGRSSSLKMDILA